MRDLPPRACVDLGTLEPGKWSAQSRMGRAARKMGELSDLELVRRLRDRVPAVREEAFAELYRRHSRRSLRLAFRVLGDAGLAADAVQDAFLTVYTKCNRFEARAQFTSWLFRVVLNRSIDLRRRGVRAPKDAAASASGGAPGDGPDLLATAPSNDPGPLARAREAERAQAVRRAISTLSPKLAEVVLLRYPEGLSYEEIGELLDLPPGTVRSRLNRAHAALREVLGSDLDPAKDEFP